MQVTVFEGSEKGAVAVKFKGVDDAERCVAMMHERRFGQSTVHCEIYDGVTDYRAAHLRQPVRSGGGGSGGDGGGAGSSSGGNGNGGDEGGEGGDVETIEDQERNLDSFANWLEADSTDEEAGGEEDED